MVQWAVPHGGIRYDGDWLVPPPLLPATETHAFAASLLSLSPFLPFCPVPTAPVAGAADTLKPPARLEAEPLRMPVTDVFKDALKGGLTMTGKIESGALTIGTRLICMPSKEDGLVKSIICHQEAVMAAYAGDNVELQVSGMDKTKLR